MTHAPRSWWSLPLAITSISWALNFVALKVVYEQMSPAALGLVRFLVMYGVLVLICRWSGLPIFPRPEHRRQAFFAGFLALGVYIVLFFEAMKRLAAAEGAILLATAPIFTAFLAAAFRQEALHWKTLIGGLVAFTGVCLVTLGGHPIAGSTPLGRVLMIASALVWASQVIAFRPVVAEYEPLSALTMAMPGALPVMLIYGGWETLHVPWAALRPETWVMLAHVCLLAGALAFVFFYRGLKEIGPNRTLVYQFTVPPMAGLFGWLILRQPMTMAQIAGIGVVLAGVGLSSGRRS